MNNGVRIYIATFIVLILAVVGNYFFGGSLTGFVVFSQYTTESSCVSAGYTWENLTNQTCVDVITCVNQTYDCEPCLEYEMINETQGPCINWTECVNETCTTTQNCTTVIIGGQCTGEVCDEDNLDLCLNESACLEFEGYWYDSLCNEDECVNDTQCDSGYICDSGECVEETTEEEEETNETVEEELIVEEPILMEPVVQFIEIKELGATEIAPFSLISGESKLVIWVVKNTGNVPVSECVLKSNGDFVNWLSFNEESLALSANEEREFSLNLTLPEETLSGNYTFGIALECSGISISTSFVLTAVEKELEVIILNTDRTSKEKVKIEYSLEELSGEDQEVTLYFSLLNFEGQEVSNLSVNKSIDANKSKEYKSILQVNESLEGNLTLTVEFNSEDYSNSVQKPILLSGAVVEGFVIFEEATTGNIILVVAVVIILVLSFFIVRLVRKNKNLAKKETKKRTKTKTKKRK